MKKIFIVSMMAKNSGFGVKKGPFFRAPFSLLSFFRQFSWFLVRWFVLQYEV
jgi:hypothetical protein